MKIRSESEVKPSDMLIGPVTLGDQIDEFYHAYASEQSDVTGAHVFMVGSKLYARGTKVEKQLVLAYFCGWSARANCEVLE